MPAPIIPEPCIEAPVFVDYTATDAHSEMSRKDKSLFMRLEDNYNEDQDEKIINKFITPMSTSAENTMINDNIEIGFYTDD